MTFAFDPPEVATAAPRRVVKERTGEPLLRILSVGAGVQSSWVAVMSAEGLLPRLDCGIFADTGDEPAAVYRHLDMLCARLPFPIHRVRYGNLAADVLHKERGQRATPPLFTEGGGMLNRQCTQTYKVEPVQRKVRELLGVAPGARVPEDVVVDLWLGISLDEAHRMKPSRKPHIRHVYPLVDARMHRYHCVAELKARHIDAPRSACRICSFRSLAGWRRMRDEAPEDFAKAVAFDRAVRDGVPGVRERLYLVEERVPLEEVDLSTAAERGQIEAGFGNECEGMCGV